MGETVGDAQLAYYINVQRRESAISYTYPSSGGQSENAHFIDPGTPYPDRYMSVISMEAEFAEASRVPARGIETIRLASSTDLVIAAIRKSAATETLCSLYAFRQGGREILCGFDLIEELGDDPRKLYYAAAPGAAQARFARYRYVDNRADFADYVGEHSYMYAKIIPLAEPFKFFNMPD